MADTKKESVSVHVSPQTRRALRALALIQDKTQGDVVEQAVRRELVAASPAEREAVTAMSDAMASEPRR